MPSIGYDLKQLQGNTKGLQLLVHSFRFICLLSRCTTYIDQRHPANIIFAIRSRLTSRSTLYLYLALSVFMYSSPRHEFTK
jgi:hypothetical protein